MTEGANNSTVDANRKSFWATSQGILTTLVAVVAAITGWIAVLNECGGPDSTTSTGSPPSLTVQAALLGPDEQRPFADHVVTVRLKADEDFLAQVDHVTYLLPRASANRTNTLVRHPTMVTNSRSGRVDRSHCKPRCTSRTEKRATWFRR
jgi:hypothetical protein